MANKWSDEDIETLRGLWEQGETAASISILLGAGFTRNSVIGKADRLGLKKPTLRKDAWTVEDVAFLKQQWANGTPRHDIAKLLKRTQQAVSTKAFNLDLPTHADSTKLHTAKANNDYHAVIDDAPRRKNKRRGLDVAAIDKTVYSTDGPKSMSDIGRNECRWAVNDSPTPTGHLFCSASTHDKDKPYCPAHSQIAGN